MGKIKHHHKSESTSNTHEEGKGNRYKEFADQCHILIHSLRLISNLKASQAEIKLSSMVLDLYAPTCKECKEVLEKRKANPAQPNKSFMQKIGDAVDGE